MYRFREVREERSITQEKCAKVAYISKKSYERYERGMRDCPCVVLKRLCKYYNLSADYILGLTDERKTLR